MAPNSQIVDANEKSINTLLFGSGQLQQEASKKRFVIVHDFLCQPDRL